MFYHSALLEENKFNGFLIGIRNDYDEDCIKENSQLIQACLSTAKHFNVKSNIFGRDEIERVERETYLNR